MRPENKPRGACYTCNEYGYSKVETRSIRILIHKKYGKCKQSPHCNRMQTHFIKDGTHPCTTNCQEGSEYKSGGYRGRIRKIPEYITGPEIKKHGNNEPNKSVLPVFECKIFYELESPREEYADAREKNGE